MFAPRGMPRLRAAEPGSSVLTSPADAHAVEIDLQAQIDRLHAVKTELELSYWDHPGEGDGAQGERYQIMFWIVQVAGRAAALEGILMHKGVPRVRVRAGSARRAKEIGDACRLLETDMPEGLPFEAVRCHVAAILRAGDTVGLAAAGGFAIDGPPRF
ncbi:MAG TPA: hypothetical protein VKW76_16805 [Candidatus Binatia bacterium]|nr:hypothetical protein [Candidatus Binatia bacterium]